MSIVATPYGRDMATVFTERGARLVVGRMVSGKRLVAEALCRRLITERGTLLDDPNYGFPIANLIQGGFTPAKRDAIPGLIRLELKKDERVDVVTTVLVPAPQFSIRLYINVVARDVGPFDFAIGIDEVTVRVLQLPEAS